MSQSPLDGPEPRRRPHPVIPGQVVHHHAPDEPRRDVDPYAVAGPRADAPATAGSAMQPFAIPQAPLAPQAPPGYGPPPMVILPEKSVGVAFVLTFFFGVFGMLYATVGGALILMGITFGLILVSAAVIGVLSILTMGVGAVLFGLVPLIGVGAWITSMIWGCTAASNHNQRVRAQYAQMAARQHHQQSAQYAQPPRPMGA
ncbi:cell division FtsX domain-containing protein [Brachybacterium subflavum]|uniref:hypothetical protein n=1 Tax=Brachybacterium subflavum TaxID=2585206 RepID=UPI001D0CEFAC|nr:hypothetical protein [Brachybacterium subflavum]